ncbi:MAG TPA: sortase, partial [Acidimicrobiales bacterium]
GLQPDRTVEVPSDPRLAGWYHLGPPPGDRGSAVILGHVDSVAGPAVFARLAELVPGDVVDVSLRGGAIASFVVRTVRTYPNADFPAQRVYGRHGVPELNLVTCGGAYDAGRGGYQANVVVNARLRTTAS